MHYQPKADLQTGAVRGVEALVRWQHPRARAARARAQFLPLAEQSGLTRALTAFVLDRALGEIGALRRRGLDIGVAVNLGPADLLDLGLPGGGRARGSSAAASTPERAHARGLRGRRDGRLGADGRRAGRRCARSGCGSSLDDFGRASRRSRHLRRLEVDELKVDRAFVLGMADDRATSRSSAATVDLGHRLGLRVVAEGVATRRGAGTLLAAWGCDEAQGDLLSRPLPADELRAWLVAHAAGAGAAVTRARPAPE